MLLHELIGGLLAVQLCEPWVFDIGESADAGVDAKGCDRTFLDRVLENVAFPGYSLLSPEMEEHDLLVEAPVHTLAVDGRDNRRTDVFRLKYVVEKNLSSG